MLDKAKSITFVFDREADSCELFDHLLNEVKSDLVIRQSQQRLIIWNGKKLKVKECLEQCRVLTSYTIDLPGQHYYSLSKRRQRNRVARQAKVEVKVAQQVELLPTETSKGKGLSPLKLNLIEVKEINCPSEDSQGPVQWRLWTTHNVDSLDAIKLVVQYYLFRWMIEQLFRVIKKTGFNQEATQLGTTQAIMKQTVMVLKAGCQILQLVYSRENDQSQPISEVFKDDEIFLLKQLNEKLEGKTEKQKNHNPTNKLSWAAWVIARLGGWKGYVSARPPGPLTMKWGLEKFYLYMDAFKSFNSS